MSIGQLADEIREIYDRDSSLAEALIEGFLEKSLGALAVSDRLTALEDLTAVFDQTDPGATANSNLEEEILSRLFSLLLGKKVSQADLTSLELLERLAESLNTIFDMLNQLVSVINTTLMDKRPEEETIRQVIGMRIEEESQSPSKSLESYLGQIKKAFLISQEAFEQAAHTKVQEILAELDPALMAATGAKGLKIGFFRNAEYFRIYEEKYHSCKKWFQSGRFSKEFLREFEKNCRKLSRE